MIAFAARAYAVTTDLARLDSGLKNEAFHVGDSLAKNHDQSRFLLRGDAIGDRLNCESEKTYILT